MSDNPTPPAHMKNAIVFYDKNEGWMLCADWHNNGKWLFKFHADGKNWYSIRAATPDDIARIAPLAWEQKPQPPAPRISEEEIQRVAKELRDYAYNTYLIGTPAIAAILRTLNEEKKA